MAEVIKSGNWWGVYSQEGNFIGSATNQKDAQTLYHMVRNSELMGEER